MRNLDASQHRLDAFIYLTQRLANVATVGLSTFAASCNARCYKQRSVDRLDYLERRDRVGRSRQSVSTIRSLLRMQQARLRQALQNLRQRLGRNAKRIGNIFRAGASLLRMVGQMLHGHQRVIRLFRQFQHLASRVCFARNLRLKKSDISPTIFVVFHCKT